MQLSSIESKWHHCCCPGVRLHASLTGNSPSPSAPLQAVDGTLRLRRMVLAPNLQYHNNLHAILAGHHGAMESWQVEPQLAPNMQPPAAA